MTPDPYPLSELPGVIAELRRLMDYSGIHVTDLASTVERRAFNVQRLIPRLLDTLEALAGDPERCICGRCGAANYSSETTGDYDAA